MGLGNTKGGNKCVTVVVEAVSAVEIPMKRTFTD